MIFSVCGEFWVPALRADAERSPILGVLGIYCAGCNMEGGWFAPPGQELRNKEGPISKSFEVFLFSVEFRKQLGTSWHVSFHVPQDLYHAFALAAVPHHKLRLPFASPSLRPTLPKKSSNYVEYVFDALLVR